MTASFAALRAARTDNLASVIVPKLLAALRQAPGPLTAPERAAMSLLARWNDAMTTRLGGRVGVVDVLGRLHLRGVDRGGSCGPRPGRKGPRRPVPFFLAGPGPLTEDLTAWTSGKAPPSAAFTLPSGARRGAPQVMRSAFGAAVAHLATRLGGAPGSWDVGTAAQPAT